MSSQSVAQIVSETMNNYLLMGHLLKCQVRHSSSICRRKYSDSKIIPQDQVHPKLWEGANKKFRQLPRARLEKERQEKVSRSLKDVWYLLTNSQGPKSRRLLRTRGSRLTRARGGKRSRRPESTTSLRDISNWYLDTLGAVRKENE